MLASLHRCIRIGLLTACSCMVLTGCQSSAKAKENQASLGSINDHCPVLGFKNVDPAAPTTTYKGHVIGFCCDSCPKKWEAWSEEKKDAYVSKQMHAPQK